MTEVAIHYNAADKLAYACRLLRKAHASGARVVVTAEPDLLQRLDTSLWSFSQLDFIPHCTEQAPPAMRAASPVLLAASLPEAAAQTTVVNLGLAVPPGFERFERLIDVVGSDDTERQHGRSRWKHYADRGYGMVRHDLAGA